MRKVLVHIASKGKQIGFSFIIVDNGILIYAMNAAHVKKSKNIEKRINEQRTNTRFARSIDKLAIHD